MKTQQEQQVQTTQSLRYHNNGARHEKLEVKLISSELCCDKLQNFSGLEEKSALYILLIICYTCCSAIKSLRTLHILQLLLSRHVGLLLHCCHHAVMLLPAASGDCDVHLAFPPAFTRLLCDAITSEAKGMKTVKAQTFTRNQEPLWVLLWANKLPAATPLRSAPHPATRLCRNHAAGFWTPSQHVSFILCTWRCLMFSTSCLSTKRLRRGSTGKPSSLVVYETQFNERNLHLCFQRLGACCFGRHPVCRIFSNILCICFCLSVVPPFHKIDTAAVQFNHGPDVKRAKRTFLLHLLEKTKRPQLLKCAANTNSLRSNCSEMSLVVSHVTSRCTFGCSSVQ